MTIEQVIPKALDTPAKQKEWLEVCEQIKKQVGYVRFYKKEVSLAQKRLQKAESELKGMRKYKEFILKGKPIKPRGKGWTKFEEE